MKYLFEIVLALSTAGGLVGAQITNPQYAQFCDDTKCSQNCGESVSVDNPGCLAETGRNGIFFHGNGEQKNLVVSPDNACSCQQDCLEGISNEGSCVDISSQSSAQSFRFQSQDCGANNC